MGTTAEMSLTPPSWGKHSKPKKDDESEFKQPTCNDCGKPLRDHDQDACYRAAVVKDGD